MLVIYLTPASWMDSLGVTVWTEWDHAWDHLLGSNESIWMVPGTVED